VVVLEGINFRYFPKGLIKDQLDLITIDVSFISLEKILPKVKEISSTATKILALVKPQFEVERKFSKKGVVKDKVAQIEAVKKISEFAKRIGFKTYGYIASPLKGPKGNTEYFLFFGFY
ncbi:MAG: SAM-dependent methyltransferase, partial [Endomicrobiia bacterium]